LGKRDFGNFNIAFFLIAVSASLSRFCRKLLSVRKSSAIIVCVSYASYFLVNFMASRLQLHAGKLVRGCGLMGLKVIMSLTRH